MPTFSTTIEDSSPVIVYSGNGGGDWTTGTSRNDTLADLYSQSSFMVTQVPKANVSFTFFGTGVQIYGAKRPNHGQFQISIDSTVYPPVNGTADAPGIFQTPLFSAAVALKNDYHTVTMTNLGTSFLDIDFITWQTPVGQTDEYLVASTVQDTDPSFVYTPFSSWNPSPPNNLGMFSGGSGHITTTAGAFMEYTFTVRAAVAIFGPVGPNNAPYSVQLDGGSPANYSANKEFYRAQQILFQAGNLGSGQHTVRMVSEAWNNSGLTFAVDFAQVFTTASVQKEPAPGSRLSTGAIAGISIGSIALLLLSAVALFTFFRRKKYGKFFRLKGNADQTPGLVTEAFNYRPVSIAESVSQDHTAASGHGHPQTTQNMQPTPPSTGPFFPSSGGTYGSQATLRDDNVIGPNSQVITIPYTDGKYRPDLPPTPLLLPPPQGVRRTPSSEGHALEPMQELQARPSGSQQLARLPSGARQPMIEAIQQPLAAFVPLQQPSSGQTGQPNQGPGLTMMQNSSSLSLNMVPPPQYQQDPS